jgi:hypothetical protein
VSPGGVIFNDAPAGSAAVELRNGAALAVGGTVRAAGNRASAIYSKSGSVTVETGGKVQSPRGAAIRTYDHGGIYSGPSTVTLKDKTGLAGETALVENGRYVSTFYGDAEMDFSSVFSSAGRNRRPLIVIAEKAELTLTSNAYFTEEADVDMEIRKGGILFSDGTVTVKGYLLNEGVIASSRQFTNDGTFHNKGEFINTGTLTNNGTLTNEGTLDTTNGKIVNNGLLDNSRGKIEGGKNILNRGKIVNLHSGGGGGCSTGPGLAGLAAFIGAGIPVCSRRKKDK